MSFITQDKTNWKYILTVLILAVIVGGITLIWQNQLKEEKLPLTVSQSSSLESEKDNKKNISFRIPEEHDFPLPSTSTITLVSSKFIPPCENPEWLSYCNVDVYTYEMETDFEKSDKWLLEETKRAGWNCKWEEDIETMMGGGGMQTECKKGDLRYGFKMLLEEEGTTQVTLFVPRGENLY